jgi:hypothetical protein
LHVPIEAVAARVPPAAELVAIDDRSCMFSAGSDTPQMLAVYLGMLDVDFDVIDPPELVEHIRNLADRYQRATR